MFASEPVSRTYLSLRRLLRIKPISHHHYTVVLVNYELIVVGDYLVLVTNFVCI